MPQVLTVDGCVLALAESDVWDADTSLSEPECREHASLSTERARADYRASRLAAKYAIASSEPFGDSGGNLDVLRRICVLRRTNAPAHVRLQTDTGSWRSASVALSLAHRDGRAAAVTAAPGFRVGVDVERADSVAYEYLRYFSTKSERERGPRNASLLWALKEAAWKVMSPGADVPFHALELEFNAAREVCGVRLGGTVHAARSLLLQPWGPTHVVAVLLVRT